nr:hypothetical protein [Delftia sp. PS-11]
MGKPSAADEKSQKPSSLALLSAVMNFVGGLGKILDFCDKGIDKIKEFF